MDSEQIQTPVDKVSLEFVDKSTQIVNLVAAHLEQACSHCQALLSNSKSKNGVDSTTSPAPSNTDEPIPEPTRNDQ